MNYEPQKPIIRWVGGKTKLLGQIIDRIPSFEGTYYEPFVGGGAVVLSLMPKKALVSDKNAELINFYTQVQQCPDVVCDIAKSFKNDEETYYEIRGWDKDSSFLDVDPKRRAARFLYLNKTCFNGLMRVNTKKGYNNTPYGRPRNVDIDVGRFVAFSRQIQHITFLCKSFEDVLTTTRSGDFVYLDPPYIPISETASYVAYTLGGFTMDDQVRLRNHCRSLAQRGVKFLQSNSDCEQTRELYREFKVETVNVKRVISAKSSSRGDASEVLIRNY